jgi:hypothetical protein
MLQVSSVRDVPGPYHSGAPLPLPRYFGNKIRVFFELSGGLSAEMAGIRRLRPKSSSAKTYVHLRAKVQLRSAEILL